MFEHAMPEAEGVKPRHAKNCDAIVKPVLTESVTGKSASKLVKPYVGGRTSRQPRPRDDNVESMLMQSDANG